MASFRRLHPTDRGPPESFQPDSTDSSISDLLFSTLLFMDMKLFTLKETHMFLHFDVGFPSFGLKKKLSRLHVLAKFCVYSTCHILCIFYIFHILQLISKLRNTCYKMKKYLMKKMYPF